MLLGLVSILDNAIAISVLRLHFSPKVVMYGSAGVSENHENVHNPYSVTAEQDKQSPIIYTFVVVADA